MTATGTLDAAPAPYTDTALTTLVRRMRGELTSNSQDDPATAAYDRILRRLGISCGIAGVIVGLVELPEIAEQGRLVPGWWTVTAVVLAFGWYPVLAVASAVAGSRAIRFAAGCAALSFLGALLTMPFAWEASSVAATIVWPYRVTALAVTAGVLAWRPRWAVAYLFAAASGAALATIYTIAGITPFAAVENFLRVMGLSSLFVWCCTAATGAAARVDRESEIGRAHV